MRVTSDLWISVLIRRVFTDGGFAAITRRGAPEAGAIFIVKRTRTGEFHLYGPAPQTSYDDNQPVDRQFLHVITTDKEEDLQTRLDREARFDPDLWVVEVEMDEIDNYLKLAAD